LAEITSEIGKIQRYSHNILCYRYTRGRITRPSVVYLAAANPCMCPWAPCSPTSSGAWKRSSGLCYEAPLVQSVGAPQRRDRLSDIVIGINRTMRWRLDESVHRN